MTEGYVASLLVTVGACLGFGGAIAWRRLRARRSGVTANEPLVDSTRLVDSSRLEEERQRLEVERQKVLLAAPLLQKQKLDSVGTLAAGVAHEINNPVHSILNYAQLLKRGLAAEAAERSFAVEIEREAHSIAEVVRHLLLLGRADETQAIAVDVRMLVRDIFVLLRAPLRDDGIKLDMVVDGEVRDIACRVQQLQLVLLNLITNAREALARRSPERTDEKAITLRALPLPGNADWLRFEVIDSGDGFDADIATRVFDPFFTTKPFGEGTGLGLSICHGIVGAHGGTMTCESQPGRRTCFVVDLPCAPQSVSRTPASRAHPPLSIPPAHDVVHPSGTRRVRHETSVTVAYDALERDEAAGDRQQSDADLE